MAQIKMRYGIDLGTTNSAICRMEQGEPVIKKTDTLKDTMPSCVSFRKNKKTDAKVIKVGDGAFNDYRSDKEKATKKWSKAEENVFLEFKRTMGLDTKYYSSNMGESYTSEELSAQVLKTLRSFISDENVEAAIITIPAKFKADQIAATKRAAELAGIKQSELLQEPIAASMTYCLKSGLKNGNLLVFDFGGGTFDAALVRVDDGIMQVKDTEGDNYLGGKNLDYAVVDEIIIPRLQDEYSIENILANDTKREILRSALKFYAEQAKNQLSFNDSTEIMSQMDALGEDDDGNPIDVDLVITKSEIEPVLAKVFQKAINITKGILERNNLTSNDLDALVLVGGPTYSPVLRKMLAEQVCPKVDSTVDPMTAVAEGAALFAAGTDCNVETKTQTSTVVLDIQYDAKTVEPLTFVSVKTLPKESSRDVPSTVYVELERSDKGWSSGKVLINQIGDVIECNLLESRLNSFSIKAYDESGSMIDVFPKEINIMHGLVVGNAVLPYSVGLEAYDEILEKDVYVSIPGLEKNQSIPVQGTRNKLRVPKELRPGINDDRLIIPIYQGEYASEGSTANLNDHVGDIVVTGDDVSSLVPYDSEVDITVKIDASQLMTVIVHFLSTNETIERDIRVESKSSADKDELAELMELSNKKLQNLRSNQNVSSAEINECNESLNEIDNRFDAELNSDDGRKHLLDDIRRVCLNIEKIEKKHEFDSIIKKIDYEFERLQKANDDLGNNYDEDVDDLLRQINQVKRDKNTSSARILLKDINNLFFQITLIYQLVGFVRSVSKDFNSIRWINPSRAREQINIAQNIILRSPSVEELRPVVISILDCMDQKDSEKIKL